MNGRFAVLILLVLGGLFFSLRPDPRERALRSQYPMLLYTICSLWILSQPIVE